MLPVTRVMCLLELVHKIVLGLHKLPGFIRDPWMTLLLASNIAGGDMFLGNMEKQGLPVCPFIIYMVKFNHSPPPHGTLARCLNRFSKLHFLKDLISLNLGVGVLSLLHGREAKILRRSLQARGENPADEKE